MANKGYVKIYRQIQDCELWIADEPFDLRSAWIDLLLSANHKDKTTLFNYSTITIKRGQLLTSVRKLSARWHWGVKKTYKFLTLLEELEMIHRESDTKKTLVTIVNYGIYQDIGNTDGYTEETERKHRGNTEETQGELNNNVKNDKNDNNDNKYNVHFEEFWKNYPRKEGKGETYKKYLARCKCGWTEEELLTACINYANDCKKTKREKQYIKHPKTFLSDTEPFVDYLKKGESSSDRRVEESITGDIERDRELEEYIHSEEFLNDDGNLF